MEKIDRFQYTPAIPGMTVVPWYRKESTSLRRKKNSILSTARRSFISNTNLIGIAFLLMAIFIILYSDNLNTESSLRLLAQSQKELAVASSLIQEHYYNAYSYASLETISRNRGDFEAPSRFEFVAKKERPLAFLEPFQKNEEYYKISSIGF